MWSTVKFDHESFLRQLPHFFSCSVLHSGYASKRRSPRPTRVLRVRVWHQDAMETSIPSNAMGTSDDAAINQYLPWQ